MDKISTWKFLEVHHFNVTKALKDLEKTCKVRSYVAIKSKPYYHIFPSGCYIINSEVDVVISAVHYDREVFAYSLAVIYCM